MAENWFEQEQIAINRERVKGPFVETPISRRRFTAPAGTIVIRLQLRKIFFSKRIRGTLSVSRFTGRSIPRGEYILT